MSIEWLDEWVNFLKTSPQQKAFRRRCEEEFEASKKSNHERRLSFFGVLVARTRIEMGQLRQAEEVYQAVWPLLSTSAGEGLPFVRLLLLRNSLAEAAAVVGEMRQRLANQVSDPEYLGEVHGEMNLIGNTELSVTTADLLLSLRLNDDVRVRSSLTEMRRLLEQRPEGPWVVGEDVPELVRGVGDNALASKLQELSRVDR